LLIVKEYGPVVSVSSGADMEVDPAKPDGRAVAVVVMVSANFGAVAVAVIDPTSFGNKPQDINIKQTENRLADRQKCGFLNVSFISASNFVVRT
jgi:hypothetical protein